MGPTTTSLTCLLFVSGAAVVNIDQRRSVEESRPALAQEQIQAEMIREEIAALKRSTQLLNQRIEGLESRLQRLENTIRKSPRGAVPIKSLLEEHWERDEPFLWDGRIQLRPRTDPRKRIRFRPTPERRPRVVRPR